MKYYSFILLELSKYICNVIGILYSHSLVFKTLLNL